MHIDREVKLLSIVTTSASHGHLELIDRKVFDTEQSLDALIWCREVDDLMAVGADGMVVWLRLVLEARLSVIQMDLLDQLLAYERVKAAVDGGEIELG